jgi:hypothetical protein
MKKLVAVLASTAFLAAGCGAAATHGTNSDSRNATVTTAGVVRVQPAGPATDLQELGGRLNRPPLSGKGSPLTPPVRQGQPVTANPPAAVPSGDRCGGGQLTGPGKGHVMLPACVVQ